MRCWTLSADRSLALVEAAHLARGVGACADEDDRNVLRLGVLLEADKDIEPVHVSEVDIEEHHIGLEHSRHPKPVASAHRAVELEPFRRKSRPEEPVDELRVIDRKKLR